MDGDGKLWRLKQRRWYIIDVDKVNGILLNLDELSGTEWIH